MAMTGLGSEPAESVIIPIAAADEQQRGLRLGGARRGEIADLIISIAVGRGGGRRRP
jgi:hypothetical protein